MNQNPYCSNCKHFVVKDYQYQHCALTNLQVDFKDSCELFELPDVIEEPKSESKGTVKKVASLALVLYIIFKVIKISGALDSKPSTTLIDYEAFKRDMYFAKENVQKRVGRNNKEIVRTYVTQNKDFSKAHFKHEMEVCYHHLNDSLMKYDTLMVRHELYYTPNLNDSVQQLLFGIEGTVINYQHFSHFKIKESN
ncbi:MAG: hypothetical protein N4A71_15790 [Carboxylicivirga sp.]|jgi:hypothetical protein|nr:hypothetical protein [Carboxylicivirga sp.]